MTIINMIGGGGVSWPKVPLDAISVITAIRWNAEATITWTDPSDLVVNWVTVTTWTSTKLVRKVGSAPTSVSDWTLVLTETVRDTYSVTWYTDTWLTNGTTYYYAAFAIADNGLATISSITPNVTPWEWTPWVNTLVYYNINDNDTNSTIYDLSWNGVDQTLYWTVWYTTDATYGRVATFDGSSYTQAWSIVNFGGELTLITLVNRASWNTVVAEWASPSVWSSVWITFDRDRPKYMAWYAWYGSADPRSIYSSSNAVSNQWVMIATTRASDGTAKIYINWTLDNTVSWMNTPDYSYWENLQIGRWRNWDEHYLNWQFKLFIGEDRCWTDAEIAALAEKYWFTVN